jgi:hypothetical protein
MSGKYYETGHDCHLIYHCITYEVETVSLIKLRIDPYSLNNYVSIVEVVSVE